MFHNSYIIGNIATIHIVLTNFCNQGCPGCYQENLDDTKSTLILDDNIKGNILKLFKTFSEQQLQIKLSFFGGEPLSRINTIIEIVKFLEDENLIPDIIHIPTSGGYNQNLIKNPKLKELLLFKNNSKFKDTKFTLSQSYDGPNNLVFRNTRPEEVRESLDIIESISLEVEVNSTNQKDLFKPEYTMNLIPQIIDENYFIDAMEDIIKVTGLYPTFRIPHLINKNSNLDSEMFTKAVRNYLEYITFDTLTGKSNKNLLIDLYTTKKLPKLFYDTLAQILQPKDVRYLWCQAGTKHLTITNKGIHPNGCEYLKFPAINLYKKLLENCYKCEIQAWCHKPCLKSMEDEHVHQFSKQCTIRKIIFNEIKNLLIGTK